jgi:hypothetical protein
MSIFLVFVRYLEIISTVGEVSERGFITPPPKPNLLNAEWLHRYV